jgi:hypothetical protein
MLYATLPHQMKALDPQKMLVLYTLVGSAKALDVPLHGIAEYILELGVRDEDGHIYGFKPSPLIPDSEANLVHSYCAVASLVMLGHPLDAISVASAVKWINSLVNEDGSVRVSRSSLECDLRMVYSACAYMDMLGLGRPKVPPRATNRVQYCNSCCHARTLMARSAYTPTMRVMAEPPTVHWQRCQCWGSQYLIGLNLCTGW